DVQVTAVADGAAALQMLGERRIDCVIMSPEAAELGDGFAVHGGGDGLMQRLPVIVYGDVDPPGDGPGWKRLAEVCTLRRAHSPDRLLDLSTFFLHRNVAKLHEDRRRQLL